MGIVTRRCTTRGVARPQSLIYKMTRRLKDHGITIVIALVASALGGSSSAYAVGHINFSQISGLISSGQIRANAVDENTLSPSLRRFIDDCRKDCASSLAMNSLQRGWEEDILQATKETLARIEHEYVHK